MQDITSKQNQVIKHIIKLHDKKYRNVYNEIIVEGVNTINDFIDYLAIKYILSTKEKVEEIQSLIGEKQIPIYIVNNALMKYISLTENPYGLLLVCDRPDVGYKECKGNGLILDSVSDPGNLGTILRSAKAFGFEHIYLYNCVDVFSPKVIRASMGSIFVLNISNISFAEISELSKSHNLFGLDMKKKNIKEISQKKDIIFVLGNEGRGLSNEVRECIKNYVSIPMSDGIESLNVAVAASIAMYSLEANKWVDIVNGIT